MKLLPIEGCGACTFLAHTIIYDIPESTGTGPSPVREIIYNCPLIETRITNTTVIHKNCKLADPDSIKNLLTKYHNYIYQLGQYFPDTEKFYDIEELQILSKAMRVRIMKNLEG